MTKLKTLGRLWLRKGMGCLPHLWRVKQPMRRVRVCRLSLIGALVASDCLRRVK
jgi:hypothetical protein